MSDLSKQAFMDRLRGAPAAPQGITLEDVSEYADRAFKRSQSLDEARAERRDALTIKRPTAPDAIVPDAGPVEGGLPLAPARPVSGEGAQLGLMPARTTALPEPAAALTSGFATFPFVGFEEPEPEPPARQQELVDHLEGGAFAGLDPVGPTPRSAEPERAPVDRQAGLVDHLEAGPFAGLVDAEPTVTGSVPLPGGRSILALMSETNIGRADELSPDAPLWQRVLASEAVRTGASWLEPLQLTHDVFMATLADRVEYQVQSRDPDASTLSDLPFWDRVSATADVVFSSVGVEDAVQRQAHGVVRDEDDTLMDRLSLVMGQLPTYAPGGEAPERPTSGAEVFVLMGAEDENLIKYGGFLLDVLGDPMMFGGMLSATGRVLNASSKAARASSKLGVSSRVTGVTDAAVGAAKFGAGDELIHFGDTLTEFFSLSGHVRAAYHGSPAMQRTLGRWYEGLAHVVENPEAGILAGRAGRGIIDTSVNWLLTPRVRGEAILPMQIPGGGSLGAQVVRTKNHAVSSARQLGDDLTAQAAQLQADVFGMELLPWYQRIARAFQGVPHTYKYAEDMPTVVREAMLRQTGELLELGGPLVHPNIVGSEAKAIRAVIDASPDLAGNPALSREAYQAAYDAGLHEVQSVARNAGITDPASLNELALNYGKLVDGMMGIDARLAFEFSGYPFMRDAFVENAMLAGLGSEDASRAWVRVMAERFKEAPDTVGLSTRELRTNVLDLEVHVMPGGGVELRNPTVPDPVVRGTAPIGDKAESVLKVRDLIGESELFSRLDLNVYLDSLADGHLRRAFGLFTSGGDFTDVIRAHERGAVLSSTLINDEIVGMALGHNPELLADWTEFLRVSGHGRTGLAVPGEAARQVRGVTINKHNMIDHLTERGVARGLSPQDATREAAEAWLDVHKSLVAPRPGVDDPLGEFVLEGAREYADWLRGNTRGNRPTDFRGADSGVFKQRQDLDEDFLSIMYEFGDPFMSLYESIEAGRKIVPIQQFMRETYDHAVAAGAVLSPGEVRAGMNISLSGERPIVNGVPFTYVEPHLDGVYAGFAGKYVHPRLVRELDTAFASGGVQSAFLNRTRSMITGSFLATAGIAVTNLVGSVFTATIGKGGYHPIDLVRSMTNVMSDVWAGNSEWLRLMARYAPTAGDEMSVISRSARGAMSMDRITQAATTNNTRAVMSELASTYQEFLQTPFGQRWLGLDGFQFADEWVRAAVMKLEYEKLTAAGVDAAVAGSRAADAALRAPLNYAEIPHTLSYLRDRGLLMYPGFPFLMTGRALEAAATRPGGLAAYDRFPDAVADVVLDPEERAAYHAATKGTWLEKGRHLPIMRRTDEDGNVRVMAIPFGQLLPTNTLGGQNPMEAMGQAGMYAAAVDMLAAGAADGEAMFGQQFGRRVYDPTSVGVDRVKDYVGFAWNSYAPALGRKAFTHTPGHAPNQGLIPAVGRSISDLFAGAQGVELPGAVGGAALEFDEVRRARANPGVLDNVVSLMLRTPRAVELSGPFEMFDRELRSAEAQLGKRVSALRTNALRERSVGNEAGFDRWMQEIVSAREEWTAEWGPRIKAQMNYLRMRQRKGGDGGE